MMIAKNIKEALNYTTNTKIIIAEIKDENSRQVALPRLLSELKERNMPYNEKDVSIYTYDEYNKLNVLHNRGISSTNITQSGLTRNYIREEIDLSDQRPETLLSAIETILCVSPSIFVWTIDNKVFFKSFNLIELIKTYLRNLYSLKLKIEDKDIETLTKKYEDSKFFIKEKNIKKLNYKNNSILLIITNNIEDFTDLEDIAVFVKEFEGDEFYVKLALNKIKQIFKVAESVEDEILAISKSVSLSQFVNFTYNLIENSNNTNHTGESIIQYLRKYTIDMLQEEQVLEKLESPYGLESIGGYDEVKQHIKKYIVNLWNNKEKVKQYNLKIDNGILLFGYPGTGKTMFAKAISKELNKPAYQLNLSKILDKYVGESEKKLQKVFDIVESAAPCILFIDEIDSVGGSRDSGNTTTVSNKVDRNIINMLLQYISNPERKSIIIGATNLIYQIDGALIRKGRLGTKLYIPFPNKEARKQIINVHLTITRNIPNDINIDDIADRTNNFTGAEIESVINEVSIEVLIEQNRNKVTTNDLIEGIDKFQLPVYRDEEIKFHNYVASIYSSVKVEGVTNIQHSEKTKTNYSKLMERMPKNIGDLMQN